MQPRHSQHTVLARQRIRDAGRCPGSVFIESRYMDQWLVEHNRYPLAVLSFGTSVLTAMDCPVVPINLPQLHAPGQIELWSSSEQTRTIRKGDCCVTMTDEVAVGVVSIEQEPGFSLDRTTYLAYHRLLGDLQLLGYPHLWRAWNYFPRINDHEGGFERYQRFCVGRHKALIEILHDFPASLPAGTAVGTASGPVQIVLLAGADPAHHLGNPRQVNAYDYPPHYGPRSPSFARATVTPTGNGRNLLVAGTASVVGHATRHRGLPCEQTLETVENLRALLHHADSLTGGDFIGSWQRGLFKVYVRNPDHLPVIRDSLHDQSFSADQLLFLQGDLCRQELLVEIEGLITSH